MPLDAPIGSLAGWVAGLNARYKHHSATAVMERALKDPDLGRIALVSSFGAESVVLLHMVSIIRPDTPVLFIDTQMLFPETLTYQRQVADHLGLRDVRTIHASKIALLTGDPDGTLHQRDTDACCALRKTAPLERALAGFDAWISGRKRAQGGARAALDLFEEEPGTGRMKVNPLVQWSATDIAAHVDAHGLPRHPLVARGYPSIGCAPCTSPVAPGEDGRAGRWRGRAKRDCGIHIAGGRLARTSDQERTP